MNELIFKYKNSELKIETIDNNLIEFENSHELENFMRKLCQLMIHEDLDLILKGEF